jgi:hypothetical protein
MLVVKAKTNATSTCGRFAFVTPRIVAAIMDGAPRVGLTATEYKLNHPEKPSL